MQEDFRFCWSQVARRVRCLLLVSSAVSLLLARLEDIFWWFKRGTRWSSTQRAMEAFGLLLVLDFLGWPLGLGLADICRSWKAAVLSRIRSLAEARYVPLEAAERWQWRTSSAGGDLRRSGRRPSWPGRSRSRRSFQRGCSGCSGAELSWSGAPGGPTA